MSTIFNFGKGDPHRQTWGTITINGCKYNLSHLNAHKVTYEHEGASFDVYVTYSHHCFTKTVKGYNDRPELMYHHEKDPRHFHEERYLLSFKLKNIIETLPNRFVAHAGYSSYYSGEYCSNEGKTIDYKVVFNVFKSNKKYRLHVSSAYLEERGKAKKVRFMKIIEALSQGRNLPLQK